MNLITAQINEHPIMNKEGVQVLRGNIERLFENLVYYYSEIGGGELNDYEYRKYKSNLTNYFNNKETLIIDDLVSDNHLETGINIEEYLNKLYHFFQEFNFSLTLVELGPVIYNKQLKQYFIVVKCEKEITAIFKKDIIPLKKNKDYYFTMVISDENFDVKISSIVNEKPNNIQNKNLEFIYGYLNIKIKPTFDEIYIDNKLCAFPSDTALAPGRYLFLIKTKGYEDYIDTMNIKIGENKLKYDLVLLKTKLKIESIPSTAKFSIADIKGFTPLEVILPGTEYIVVLEKSGYQKFIDSVNLFNVKDTTITATLKKNKVPPRYRVKVKSRPRGANLQMGAYKSKTPQKLFVGPGDYTITLTKTGYTAGVYHKTIDKNSKFKFKLHKFETINNNDSTWISFVELNMAATHLSLFNNDFMGIYYTLGTGFSNGKFSLPIYFHYNSGNNITDTKNITQFGRDIGASAHLQCNIINLFNKTNRPHKRLFEFVLQSGCHYYRSFDITQEDEKKFVDESMLYSFGTGIKIRFWERKINFSLMADKYFGEAFILKSKHIVNYDYSVNISLSKLFYL